MPPKAIPDWLITIKDQEHFDAICNETTSKLQVLDIFPNWSGPCFLIQPQLKNICFSYEEWEKRLEFLVVDTEKVPTLKELNHSSKPKFVLFLQGRQVAEVNGANESLLKELISKNIPHLED